jgi:hypothetical protein
MADAVYVIVADNGDVKVGISGTPYARLSKVKRDYGPSRGFQDARLVGFVLTGYAYAIEHFAIRRLLPHATGGEWFRIDPMRAGPNTASIARRSRWGSSYQRGPLASSPGGPDRFSTQRSMKRLPCSIDPQGPIWMWPAHWIRVCHFPPTWRTEATFPAL